MTSYLLAAAVGLAAGMLAGMFGVGGGILFVPALVFLGLSQIEAEGTSLLAILPTVAAGAWRQHRYGNVDWRGAALVGAAAVPGVAAGSWLAVSMSQDLLQTLFAMLMLVTAAHLAWRTLRQ